MEEAAGEMGDGNMEMICCVAMVHEARPCFVVMLGGCATSLPHGMYHHSATACRSQGDIFPGETPVAQNVALCLFSTFFCLRTHTIIRSTKSISGAAALGILVEASASCLYLQAKSLR
jgi:hypothetical protein